MAEVVGFLDQLAVAHGKSAWVEKTPRHVLHASRIARVVPSVHCVHMVRAGEDVVASIVDRARRFPDRFPRQEKPAYGIRQWNDSLAATHAVLEEAGHRVVFYDELVADSESTLRALCRSLGLEFEEEMLLPADRRAFTTPDELWKAGVDGSVRRRDSKFGRLFDEGTQRRIRDQLRTDLYEELKERASDCPGGVIRSGPIGR
jgi:hypothetical protein